MITPAHVRATLEVIIGDLASEIADEFNRRGVGEEKLLDVIRYVFRSYGNAVDAEAVKAFFVEREPGLEIEALGRNEESGYVWARAAKGAERGINGVLPPSRFRKVFDPFTQFFVPGEIKIPTEDDIIQPPAPHDVHS